MGRQPIEALFLFGSRQSGIAKQRAGFCGAEAFVLECDGYVEKGVHPGCKAANFFRFLAFLAVAVNGQPKNDPNDALGLNQFDQELAIQFFASTLVGAQWRDPTLGWIANRDSVTNSPKIDSRQSTGVWQWAWGKRLQRWVFPLGLSLTGFSDRNSDRLAIRILNTTDDVANRERPAFVTAIV